MIGRFLPCELYLMISSRVTQPVNPAPLIPGFLAACISSPCVSPNPLRGKTVDILGIKHDLDAFLAFAKTRA